MQSNSENEIIYVYRNRRSLTIYLILCFGLGFTVIIDEFLLSEWYEEKIIKVYHDTVNGTKWGRGTGVTKIQLDRHTLVTNKNIYYMLDTINFIEIRNTKILNRVTYARIKYNHHYHLLPFNYSINNAYFLFPISLCLASLLALFYKNKNVFYYSTIATVPISLYLLYGLIFN